MFFGQYIKLSRERYNLTQEELVQECYNYHEDFQGLNIVTLSRWERGITSPNVDKQIKIVKLLQGYDKTIFPYFNSLDASEVEKKLSKDGIQNLIANSKDHIMKFPSSELITENLKVSNIADYENIEAILKMPNDILYSLIDNHYELNIDILKSWAKHKANLFIVSEYDGYFFGMMFTIKLKPEVFEEVLSFKKPLKTLQEKDFVDTKEIGSNFIISFFAYNQTIAVLFYLRCYANLIANQDTILEVGSTPVLESGVKLAKKINLKEYVSNKEKISYRASLKEILLREDVFKMVFKK